MTLTTIFGTLGIMRHGLVAGRTPAGAVNAQRTSLTVVVPAATRLVYFPYKD